MTPTKQNLNQRIDRIYDVLIVGGGVGGLSADKGKAKGKARSHWMQELHNYLGFPQNTSGREVLKP